MIENGKRLDPGPHCGQRQENSVRNAPQAPAVRQARDAIHTAIPFGQRLTCTIAEACEATGLGQTKLYELIGKGQLVTTMIGRRRLVLLRSLRTLVGVDNA
jgi:excisionase family DNA binding protein